jgi:hypothetical protein
VEVWEGAAWDEPKGTRRRETGLEGDPIGGGDGIVR